MQPWFWIWFFKNYSFNLTLYIPKFEHPWFFRITSLSCLSVFYYLLFLCVAFKHALLILRCPSVNCIYVSYFLYVVCPSVHLYVCVCRYDVFVWSVYLSVRLSIYYLDVCVPFRLSVSQCPPAEVWGACSVLHLSLDTLVRHLRCGKSL